MGKFFHVSEPIAKGLLAVYPVSSTVTGFVNSTDIGKLVTMSSNHGGLALGTTADNQVFLGYVAAVPTATTPGSTVPFYVQPVLPCELLEGEFSTSYSTALPASTDAGKYLGFSNTTTVAGAALDMDTLGNAKGTTSGCFFRINSVPSTNVRKVVGSINSSHLVM
jgi:hypothetical protein